MPAVSKLATHELAQAGQSPWLDSLSRDMLNSGRLRSLVERSGVLGLTSNPSIFQSAIAQGSQSYRQQIQRLAQKGLSALEIYDRLSIEDIQSACDIFKKTWLRSKGEYGYVSLEVLPNLAADTRGTVAEAKRLWKRVARPNLMVKVPATPQGIPAIQALIADGININVTLIFSMEQYQAVAEAYQEGLRERLKNNQPIKSIRSVASVFVSRFDTRIDKELEKMAVDSKLAKSLLALRGKAGIANSKLIYKKFQELFAPDFFADLEKAGAQVQKVLWGSTSCKNPNYSDLLYVESLVGRNTVNTMPEATLMAVLDHACITPDTIESDLSVSETAAKQLSEFGLDLNRIGLELQKQGVELFCDAFRELIKTLEIERMGMLAKAKTPRLPTFRTTLKQVDHDSFVRELQPFEKSKSAEKFFARDPRFWKSDETHQQIIKNRLGWMNAHERILGHLHEAESLLSDLKKEGFQHLILLGMGGSSLAPEVMSLVCPRAPKSLSFQILDSTDPAAVRAAEKSVNLKKTLFIVASKSGSTVETLSQLDYFSEKIKLSYGKKATLLQTGSHFIAITDPGSSLQNLAKTQRFRHLFLNPADIGGRYSALSLFGAVPAVLMGINIRSLLAGAKKAYEEAENTKLPLGKNEPFALGILLGALAKSGKDKLTLVTSKSLTSFGAWLEQLIAESTGKEKKGILPVDTEELGAPSDYAEDRFFVSLRLKSDPAGQGARLNALKKSGFPVIELEWPEAHTLGAEFLNWEIITAVSSAIIGVNPFDEPNVTESKQITQQMLAQIKKGQPIEKPTRYFYLKKTVEWGLILKQIRKGSYVSLLAYTPRDSKTQKAFQKLRTLMRRQFKVPVLLGFGPRYLHSIGQFYKGGTASGLFIEFHIEDKADLPIPGQPYSFSQLKEAQALGDFEAIQNKGLPIIAVQLGTDAVSGIDKVEKQIASQISRK